MKEQIQAQGARFWVQAAMIGAIYVVLTLLFCLFPLAPYNFGFQRHCVFCPILHRRQFRASLQDA